MPWNSVQSIPRITLVNRDNVCGYDFTLEQFNETCSKKKSMFGSSLCLHVISPLIHLGPKQPSHHLHVLKYNWSGGGGVGGIRHQCPLLA